MYHLRDILKSGSWKQIKEEVASYFCPLKMRKLLGCCCFYSFFFFFPEQSIVLGNVCVLRSWANHLIVYKVINFRKCY